jgi:hypothetical protein
VRIVTWYNLSLYLKKGKRMKGEGRAREGKGERGKEKKDNRRHSLRNAIFTPKAPFT